ncbi:MAG TPA: hypothetical protein VKA49_01930 [Flavitalea sp.]|nr:hypothetical protein [Flavitalea sp.]
MKRIFAVLLCASSHILFSQTSVTNLTCEKKRKPLDIDVAAPRLSWQLTAKERNLLQAA